MRRGRLSAYGRWHAHVQSRARANRVGPQVRVKLAQDRLIRELREKELAEQANPNKGEKPKTQ